ncbi:MAG TPA: thiol-disulfide isomerase [Bryobacteraceae bacterium]|nr:thiol-disulfide isomerase [Bryobacteraceae bacterium]
MRLFAVDPTFYRDVLPILQKRCQECHRAGEMAPMPFATFEQTRPWAKGIRDAVRSRKMPPWFADPCCGKFANDRSLSPVEIETLARWAETGARKGESREAPAVRVWPARGNLDSPDATLSIPRAFDVPAAGALEYQSFVVSTGFREDRWIQAAEVRPGVRSVVHHVVVYIRDPGDTWIKGPTKSDILSVWAPGSAPDTWPDGMAKLIPAGADLVFEIHYTPTGTPARDRTSIALKFAAEPPARRVLTLQLNNDRFLIPAGERDYRVTAVGTLPNEALLLGFFPHMHLRGTAFEYTRLRDDGQPETLLRVRDYKFNWQLTYRLATPIALPKGTPLRATAHYDNSARNPRNPDPTADVRYGQQSWEEMMIGFFDVAVDAKIDKKSFFVR